jgi:hypothetical protein
MNILDKLRRQSSAEKFRVNITRQEAKELMKCYCGDDFPEAKRKTLLENYGKGFKGSADENYITCHLYTERFPIIIDHDHQVLMDSYYLLQVFTESTFESISVFVQFVKSAPVTDQD